MKIAWPLRNTTRRDSHPNLEDPTEKQLHAFKTLKLRLITPPVLAVPKAGKAYFVDIDASEYQLGATLLQLQEDEFWRSVGYWSNSLNDAERNYSATKRKSYAVVWAVTTLQPYIEGTHSTVGSDHDLLNW